MTLPASTCNVSRRRRPCATGLALLLAAVFAAGCSNLKPETSPTPPTYYSLDGPGGVPATSKRATPATGYTVIVNTPQASAGVDSQRILYVRQAHKLEYFAHNEWVDPPARMLAPLIVTALESTGAFRAVISGPGSASGDLRLETEVLKLQQEFVAKPSQVRIALRAYLAESNSRRVVATRDFEVVQPAPSDDPYGGVQAANVAMRTVLQQLAAFCAETAAAWQPSRTATQAR